MDRNEEGQEFDQILTAFLDKWHEGLKDIPERMADIADSGYRDFLSHYDPFLSKVVEGHTAEEVRSGHEKLALASAITHAILTAHNILK